MDDTFLPRGAINRNRKREETRENQCGERRTEKLEAPARHDRESRRHWVVFVFACVSRRIARLLLSIAAAVRPLYRQAHVLVCANYNRRAFGSVGVMSFLDNMPSRNADNFSLLLSGEAVRRQVGAVSLVWIYTIAKARPLVRLYIDTV